MHIFGLFILVSSTDALSWGKFPLPRQMGLSELVTKLSQSGTTNTTSMSMADEINTLMETIKVKVNQSQTLVAAQLNELSVASELVNRTVAQVEVNEQARISIIKTYNQNAVQSNQMLVDMTTGAQQINDNIAVSNRIKSNLATDIVRINDAISVTNDWMVKMDAWVAFVLDETTQIDQAQANLLQWGDATKENMNTHEVAALKLAREAYDLETQIVEVNNIVLGTGALLGYTPATLSIPDAAGGFGWSYSYWS
jgi:hypothetical protein